jgi:hypothetical protein
MKNIMKALAIIVFASAVLFTACGSPEKKVDKAWEKAEDAKEDLSDAKEDLAKAKQDSIDDYAQYKLIWVKQIAKNEDLIAEYRLTIDKMKDKQAKAKAKKDADELEKKNKEMKAKLENSKKDSNWDKFKREFEHDMDELGEGISDLFKDNEN